ncbi:hypothetical protein AVEN_184371-1 [Araneus ventricosus]|uniref:Uncharacterized protein n=1 Tax=Araneus ventricosus TaxID=182803 RepID=A0A4Y2BHD4_ARAVE|nr:hypothetical protein AVEN_184371-1 [Araneus ventricosus]
MKSTMVLWTVPLIFMQYLKQKKVVTESLEATNEAGVDREPAQRAVRAASTIEKDHWRDFLKMQKNACITIIITIGQNYRCDRKYNQNPSETDLIK